MKKQNPETVIQNSVRDYLRYRGWYVIRNQQGLGSHAGMSDLTVIKNGIVVFVEVKTDRGRLSDHQKKFQQDIAIHGGCYEVVTCIEDAEAIDRRFTGGNESVASLLSEKTEEEKPRRFKYPR